MGTQEGHVGVGSGARGAGKGEGLQTLGRCVLWWNNVAILGQQECPKDPETFTDNGNGRQGALGELEQRVNDTGSEAGPSGGKGACACGQHLEM